MAVDLPAPEKPVITTKSRRREEISGRSALPAARRSSPARSGRSGLMTAIAPIVPTRADARGSSGAVQMAVQLAPDLRRQAGHRLQLPREADTIASGEPKC